MNNLPVHRTACKLRLQVPPPLRARAPGYLQRIAYGLLLTIAVCGLNQAATAAEIIYATVNHWSIVKDLDNKACFMAAAFTRGTMFALVVSTDGRLLRS